MIRVVFVGRIKDRALQSVFNDYLQRLSRFTKVEVVEIKDEPLRKNQEHIAREKEADRILAKVKGDHIIVLDVKGRHFTSEQFASHIKKTEVMKRISFIVGGPTGLHDRVLRSADLAISFSTFTMGNQIMRLVLLEQLYRAYSILHNTPYHR
jgi:23S rRNA (pseudouridine1915-N3)-methyltransferase